MTTGAGAGVGAAGVLGDVLGFGFGRHALFRRRRRADGRGASRHHGGRSRRLKRNGRPKPVDGWLVGAVTGLGGVACRRIAGTSPWSVAATPLGAPAVIPGPASNARSQIWKDETTPATTRTAQTIQGKRLRTGCIIAIRQTQSMKIYGTSAKITQTGGLARHPDPVFALPLRAVESEIGGRHQLLGSAGLRIGGDAEARRDPHRRAADDAHLEAGDRAPAGSRPGPPPPQGRSR